MSVSISFCVNTAAASPRCFVKPSPSSDVPAHGRYFRWRDRAVDIICFKLSPSLLFKQGTWPAHRVKWRATKRNPNQITLQEKGPRSSPPQATLRSPPPPCSRSVPYASHFPLGRPSAPHCHHIHGSQVMRLPNAQLADSTFGTAGPSVRLTRPRTLGSHCPFAIQVPLSPREDLRLRRAPRLMRQSLPGESESSHCSSPCGGR